MISRLSINLIFIVLLILFLISGFAIFGFEESRMSGAAMGSGCVCGASLLGIVILKAVDVMSKKEK